MCYPNFLVNILRANLVLNYITSKVGGRATYIHRSSCKVSNDGLVKSKCRHHLKILFIRPVQSSVKETSCCRMKKKKKTHYAPQLSFMHLKATETNLSKSQVILNSEFILLPLFTQMDDVICILKMRNQLWGSTESRIRIDPKTSRPPVRLKRETLKTRTSKSGANLENMSFFFSFLKQVL